ncbi:MAG: hypothetical protein QXU87_10180 [Candidatus Caldarchaeum sp.]|uniref:Uncharacterized protein n=1 Tax=Caldiarchaeum subterraneum TaxID=311458 RepID=A0A7C5QCQ2_CALS0
MSDVTEIYTWYSYRRDEQPLVSINWNSLISAVKSVNLLIDSLPQEHRQRIEEPKPFLDQDSFNPQGWVGTYNLGGSLLRVIPNPELLSREDFYSMVRELIGWAEYVGPFFEDFLRFYCCEPTFKFLFPLSYSNHLKTYTELIVSHFIPRRIVSEEKVGYELSGPLVWSKALYTFLGQQNTLVFKKTRTNLNTLTNMLLVRFHAEILKDINAVYRQITCSFSNEFGELQQAIKTSILYHNEFIGSNPWNSLLQQSVVEDFESATTYQKLRNEARGVWSELVDLWESYRSKKSELTNFGKRFDSAIKPLSKLYELWCLKKLCEILNIDNDKIKNFSQLIFFEMQEQSCKLHYGRSLHEFSGILSNLGIDPGIPDFLIQCDREILCVIDAKCKTELRLHDMQRFLSYLLDYMYPRRNKMTGIILHAKSTEEISHLRVRDLDLYLVPMLPSSFERIKPQFEQLLTSLFSSAIPT